MDISEGVSVDVHYILSLFVCSSVGFRYTLTQTDKRAHPPTHNPIPTRFSLNHTIFLSAMLRLLFLIASVFIDYHSSLPVSPSFLFSFVCERALWVSLSHLFQLCVHMILEDRTNIVVYTLSTFSKNFLESDNQITCAHYSLQNMLSFSESFAGCFRPFLTNDSTKNHLQNLAQPVDKPDV